MSSSGLAHSTNSIFFSYISYLLALEWDLYSHNIKLKSEIAADNLIKDKVKLQFTIQDNYRREIRIEPEVFTIGKGEECEFEIFI